MLDPLSQFLVNLKDDKIISVGFNLISTFCPCLLTLFFFDTNLFNSMDTMKLILLCFSVGCPFLFFTFWMTIGVSTGLKRMVTSILEMKELDKYKITHDKIDSLTKSFSTRLTCGLLSSLCWMITAVFCSVGSYFIQFDSIEDYGYCISIIYVLIVLVVSILTSKAFNSLSDILDKKNDEDYATATEGESNQ